MYNGTIDITADDDCLNAANPDLTGCDYAMNICGGTIMAYSAAGDGFDSNGTMTFTGGTVAVWTASTADNEPLDADGTITVTGGTILAAGGSSGMGMTIDAQQPYVTFGESAGMGGPGGRPGAASTEATTTDSTALRLAAGDSFTLVNAAGESLYSGTAVCAARYLFYSSADLADGESYSIGSVTSAAQTGTATTGMAGGPGNMGGEMSGETGGPADGQRPGDDGHEPPEKPAA